MGIDRRSRDISEITSRAVEHLGKNDFYDFLLGLLAIAAPHDLAALVRYSRSSPPDLILPRTEPTDTLLSYSRDFYALDPFFTHWSGGGEIGVYRLRAMAHGIGRTRYAKEFLSAMHIHDEIAVFLPPVGDSCPTLLLDRKDGVFSASEVERAKNLFPLLAALHRKHLEAIVTRGPHTNDAPFGREKPLRLMDQHDRQVFATAAWTKSETLHGPKFNEALTTICSRGPCMVELGGGFAMRRTRLPADFGPAPGGFCDEVSLTEFTEKGAYGTARLPAGLLSRITEREANVVLLTLQGYPILEIARKLGLSRGTVKNYRLSIYRKLDITTERELFGEYMRAVNAPL